VERGNLPKDYRVYPTSPKGKGLKVRQVRKGTRRILQENPIKTVLEKHSTRKSIGFAGRGASLEQHPLKIA